MYTQTKMSEDEQLKRMVMTFRVSELQMLLGYAGKNKTGRKNELQNRAMDIVKLKSPTINQKIRELYKSIQPCPTHLHNIISQKQEMMSFGDRSQGAAVGLNASIMPTQRSQSAYNQSCISVAQPAQNYNRNTASTSSHSNSYGSQSQHNSPYPINPDVKMKPLPFFDIMGDLLKPCTLAPHGSGRYQEATFSFSLTPQQATSIAHSRDLRPNKQDYSVQVQMRYCLLETTCSQDDNFPPNLTVKINDKACPLPTPLPTTKAGVEPKRPSKPVNITGLCKISPTVANRILVSWSSEYGRCYVISVYLVKKLTSDDLLQRLKIKGPRLPDFTKSLIKQKLIEDGECEIATTSLRCSLLCPLGKMRMMLPCRADTCMHLQCFDASLYLQMNERKPTWTCPVCDKSAIYDTLVIDGYFQEVLQKDAICTEVTLNKDGSWTPLLAKKEPKEPQQEKKKSEVAVETLSDDSDEEDSKPKDGGSTNERGSKRKVSEVEIITLDDSDIEEPPAKKSKDEKEHMNADLEESGPDSVRSQECTKSNDSWHVGEVEHGKRLVFRKSLSNSSGDTSGSQSSKPKSSSPSSSRSSPQIICLDSPATSPSPPKSVAQVATATVPSVVATAVPTTEPPPYASAFYNTSDPLESPVPTTSNSESVDNRTTPPVTITPVSTASPQSASNQYMVSDPLATPTYIPSPGFGGTPYQMASNLQSLFNPLSLMSQSSTSSPTDYTNYRPDRYM